MMSTFWLGLGLFAQALFSARFTVQWLASERAKQSVIPLLFWRLRIAGSGLLLIYSIPRLDPVFTGCCPNAFSLSSAPIFDTSKACSRRCQNSPFGLKSAAGGLIFRFAKMYWQKTAQ
jgi:lipid-A-disaccharide synthase-like uncharacterized protein